jgi:hypothetical protein
MFVWRLRLVDQTAEDAGKCHSFLHSPTRRGRRKSLQVEGKVVLDRGAGLYRLYLEGSADVGERRGTERQRFRVVLLPSLIFRPQVECARMLEVWGQHDVLVAAFPRELDPEIPGFQSHEDRLEIVLKQMLVGKGVEAADGIVEGTSIPNVLPSQGSQAGYTADREVSGRRRCERQRSVCPGKDSGREREMAQNLLHRGVIGVF